MDRPEHTANDAAHAVALVNEIAPDCEMIVMARKPAPKATLLNIDACRIAGAPSGLKPYIRGTTPPMGGAGGIRAIAREGMPVTFTDHPSGRWPANVVLDEEAAKALDEMSGEGWAQTRNVTRHQRHGDGTGRNAYGVFQPIASESYSEPNNTGGASRFFYCAKASRSEREAGLDGFAVKPCGTMEDDAYKWEGGNGHAPHNTKRANGHPTVKPIALMRWLVRLVTPVDGTVLDPFTGSGTTGIAATLEGRSFIGIEREAEYVEIARARIAHHSAQKAMAIA